MQQIVFVSKEESFVSQRAQSIERTPFTHSEWIYPEKGVSKVKGQMGNAWSKYTQAGILTALMCCNVRLTRNKRTVSNKALTSSCLPTVTSLCSSIGPLDKTRRCYSLYMDAMPSRRVWAHSLLSRSLPGNVRAISLLSFMSSLYPMLLLGNITEIAMETCPVI